MAKTHYVPASDEGKMTWLNNFASKISVHAPVLGISQQLVTSVQNDMQMFTYMVNVTNSFKAGLSEIVGYKDILKNGNENMPLNPVPVFNNTPPPTLVPAGIFRRVSKLIMTIKGNPNYNESIGEDLGIIGTEQSRDTMEMKPVLKIRTEAGKPRIIWKKGDADSLDIYVDRGDNKGFVYLANDFSPDYTDNTPLSGESRTAEWRYKAIYRLKDEQVGSFSDEVSVTVKKEI